MIARHRALALFLLVALLVTGCGAAEPTATPVPATATQIAAAATNTPLAPTATPAPPTATAVPPTLTSTPLPSPTVTPVPPTAIPPATATPAPLLLLENRPQLFGRTETFQVGLGDLDGDGDLDAVLANMAANDSQVWFNDGTGQFTDSGQRLTQQGHGVDLGDLDGDGDLDIYMTCAHFGSGRGWSKQPSRVYLNNGQGAFEDSGQDLGDAELSGNGVNLIDLEGDGDLDAHVIYYQAADRVYLNDGTGRFSDSGLALTEEEIAWGDLDADGDVDILAKAHGQGYWVLLNDGTGQFITAWRMEDSGAMYGDLALADLDGDGDLDALLANGFRSEGSFPTRLLWNDGTGQFTDSGQELNETSAAKFAVGDLDRDGSLDVFVSNMDRLSGEAWLNDGTGRLADSGLRLESPSRHLATWPSLGDLDGDGDLDLVEAGFQGKAEVWRNTTPLPAGDGGGVIAFTTERDGNFEIYSMNADGSDQRRLTNQPGEDYWPTWSPDGAQIAFASERDGNFEIYTMNADGGNLRRLTHEGGDDLEPDWSPGGAPGGEQIAFMYYSAGRSTIYVMDADGSNRRPLTDGGSDDWLPAWSPDGKHIVFVSLRDGNPEIYVMDADGGDQRRLTNNDGEDSYPAWSPDGAPGGEQISFFSSREGGRELYVMDADGSNLRALTHDNASVWVSAWSPDGTQIAFTSGRDGDREIYVMDPDGNNLRQLTDNHVLDGIPAWRPNTTTPAVTAAPPGTAVGDTWTRPTDGMTMVYVPGGSFAMGSAEDDPEAVADELPQHMVTLDGFWIDQTEVTNAQFVQFLNEHGNSGAGEPKMIALDQGYVQIAQVGERFEATKVALERPVVMVTWHGAAAYCEWAGGRLPTEAEWEYAARGPEGNLYPWGNAAPTCDLANYGTCVGVPVQVGSLPAGASWCGALDMAGNVWEWVADRFGPYTDLPQVNPTGPAVGEVPLLRGGGWHAPQWEIRAAYRQHELPATGFNG